MKSREVRGYELLKKETNNKQYYYHQNEHGDVTHLTNVNGEVENSYSYDVFGNIREEKEAIFNYFKYSGEQYEKEIEQYYLRARFYNPVIGRFTQEDVYRGDGLNLYVYVVNNPLLWVDPSGLAKCFNSNDGKEFNNKSYSSFADLMTPEEAARYKKYFVKDAPYNVSPGLYELKGIHIHHNNLTNIDEIQPWKAHYDDWGRLIARTDYNAGNKKQNIPDTHYHLYEWGIQFGGGKSPHEYASHLKGEFK